MNKVYTNSFRENQGVTGEMRFVLVLFLTLVTFSTLLISTSHLPQAYAKTTTPYIQYSCNPRCWGTNYWPNAINGAFTYLYWNSGTSFYYGDGFVQNTMWIVDESQPTNCYPNPSDLPSTCFVEAGIRAYESGGVNVTSLFWGDTRPGYHYAYHYGGLINTQSPNYAVDIQIFKAGTISGNLSWCPVAGSEWCVYLNAQPGGPTVTDISGLNHTNTMRVTGYREGMEMEGTKNAFANPMNFTSNEWQSNNNNNYYYQSNSGDVNKYQDNPPVDSYWVYTPNGQANNGGSWETCITGAGC